MYSTIVKETERLIDEFLTKYTPPKGSTILLACSTSEVQGKNLGSASSVEVAKHVFDTLSDYIRPKGINIVVQCCEHLNRCIVLERSLAEQKNLPIVNVVPQPKAGGAFATHAYHSFKEPAVVEHIQADFGIDIGLVMIGMHLKEVAVPLRLSQRKIGEATVACARTRPKFIGGERAAYNQDLL